jgi:environmental stress-induced protein Ves
VIGVEYFARHFWRILPCNSPKEDACPFAGFPAELDSNAPRRLKGGQMSVYDVETRRLVANERIEQLARSAALAMSYRRHRRLRRVVLSGLAHLAVRDRRARRLAAS